LFHPLFKALNAFRTEGFQAAECSFGGLLYIGMCLTEKLVGVADKLLFEGFRKEIFRGERKVASHNLLSGESCSGVALANAGVRGVSLLAE
jgi:hypothetical protein